MDKTNSSWLKTFSIGFSIISFGITIAIIGYIVLTTKQNQTAKQPSPTSLPAETLVKEGDETANWKTYTITATLLMNLTLKYPPNIKFDHKELFSGTNQYLRFETKNGYMTLETLGCNTIYPNPSLEDNIRIGETVIEKSQRYRIAPSGGYNQLVANPKLQSGECVNVTMGLKPESESDTKKLFDQILSTFRFTP